MEILAMCKSTVKSLDKQIKMHMLFQLDPVPGVGGSYIGQENADLNSLLLHSPLIYWEMGRTVQDHML